MMSGGPPSGSEGPRQAGSDEHLETGRTAQKKPVAPVPLGIGRWSRWLAVAGGFGYLPKAPGTAGSAVGVIVFLALAGLGLRGESPARFVALYVIAVVALLLLGIRAAGRAEVDFGRRDDGRIVIDEVVGQLIGLSPLALVLSARMPLDPWTFAAQSAGFVFFFEVVTGFVLFRLFDVWKPGAIRWAEQRFEGGLGVMADDLVAGLYAAVVLLILHLLVFERLASPESGSASSSALSVLATSRAFCLAAVGPSVIGSSGIGGSRGSGSGSGSGGVA